MAFLSDSSDEEFSSTSFQEKIYAQLISAEYDPEPSATPGQISDASIISQQPLFLIIDFFENSFSETTERIVRLWAGPGHEERFVHLRDSWYSSQLSSKDPMFVIGDWVRRTEPHGVYSNKLSMIVDAQSGFIIVQPHVLIPATKLAACQECERKGYLLDTVFEGTPNLATLIRTFVQSLIERIIGSSLPSTDLEMAVDKFLDDEKFRIVQAGETRETVRHEAESYLPILRQICLSLEHSLDPVLFGPSDRVCESMAQLPPYGLKSLQTDERIWSFQWGLKGTIDLTLEHEGQFLPVELKSGSCSTVPYDSHILQLSGYIFMLKEKYGDKAVSSGALFYAKNSISFKVNPKRCELMHIIIKRNRIAHALTHGEVPPTTHQVRTCRFCDVKSACAFLEDHEEVKSPITRDIEEFLCYRPAPHHHDFYRKWEQTLLDDLQVIRKTQTDLWLKPVEQRVRAGQVITGLRMSGPVDGLVTFEFDPEVLRRTNIGITSHVMLTRGGVLPIVGHGNVCSVDGSLLAIDLFESTLHESEDNICADIWEATSSVDICRRNLMALFTSEPAFSNVHVRDLVVDLTPPRFDPLPPASTIAGCDGFNEDQILVMRTEACALDYMLLLGMPGTGKTTIIAAMIKAIAAEGQTVLITSYTHNAVDNVCFKLIELCVNFLRIGNLRSFHNDLRSHALETIVSGERSVDDIATTIGNCRIFAATCLGFHRVHPIIKSRLYDLCIIDEASQINVPTILGPLLRSRRFILVGDHYQLPPIKKYSRAIHEESPSLFRVLCEAHPHAIVTLRTQYRMNREIMNLCNSMIYSLRMRCNTPAVACYRLQIPHLEIIDQFSVFHREWIRRALEAEPPVLMFDTDDIPMHERPRQGSIVNYGEAAVASAIAVAMVVCGMDPAKVGIIAPYRAQVMYLQKAVMKQLEAIAHWYPKRLSNVKEFSTKLECDTVDKFQGRDKDVILFSAVKSNRERYPGNHITDWRRLNVAVTRAKSKFILIGSRLTLMRAPVFHALFHELKADNIFALPYEIDRATAKPFSAMSAIANPHELNE
jgi:DNA replication ATP-dependent helicase Dna2